LIIYVNFGKFNYTLGLPKTKKSRYVYSKKRKNMKRFFAVITFVFLSSYSLKAQSDFSPGWHIIQSSAKYTVIRPSGSDFQYDNKKGCWDYPVPDFLLMKAGEVVLAFEYSGGKVYGFDPNGRMLVFESLTGLVKAPVSGAGVGLMLETIELIDGSDLSKGSYVWITGQDIAKETIKIQVQEGKQYDIPKSKISLYSVDIKKMAKSETFKLVEP